MEGKIKLLKNLLSKENKIVITTHTNPDGDAIGSSLALFHLFKKMNFNVKVITPNQHPEFLDWVPGCEQLIVYEKNEQLAKKTINNSNLIFTLDFNDLNRSGKIVENIDLDRHKLVMIDHHQSPNDYASIMFSYPEFSSTCELIFNIAVNLGKKDLIDKEISTCLYLGIMTDTGSFQYNGVNGNTHHTLSFLLEKGIDHNRIYNNIYNSHNLSKLKILGCAIKNLSLIHNKKTSYTFLTKQELKQNQYKKGDSEGIVNYGLSLKNIQFTAIFIEDELEVSLIKISFRSKNEFPCDRFAKEFFSGGGHKNAAGGKFEGTMINAIKKFQSSLKIFKTN
tara:strand:+ start:76 stop:1083 length:1008 start_codon:yes stop_codon:yes gene_type:complete